MSKTREELIAQAAELGDSFETDAFTRMSREQESAALALRDAVVSREQADQAIIRAVVAGRAAGLTWARIAEFLGVTTQAAHQRFKDVAQAS